MCANNNLTKQDQNNSVATKNSSCAAIKQNVFYHLYDLPIAISDPTIDAISIDTEAIGLNTSRDRLCMVQIKIKQKVFLIHFPEPIYNKSPNLIKILKQKKIIKYMHYAPFDMEMLGRYLKVIVENVRCTRTLSKITRTFANAHGLKHLCRLFLKKDLNKNCQSSYWGADTLTHQQLHYASQDVLYLESLYCSLEKMAIREKRLKTFQHAMQILPHMIYMSIAGYNTTDIFHHT